MVFLARLLLHMLRERIMNLKFNLKQLFLIFYLHFLLFDLFHLTFSYFKY